MSRLQNVDERILAYLHLEGPQSSADLVRKFRMSRPGLHRHLNRLVQNEKIVRVGRTRNARYILNRPSQLEQYVERFRFERTFQRQGLAEDRVLRALQLEWAPYRTCRDNVRQIFDYAISEMINNAIDHSESSTVTVRVIGPDPMISFDIIDRGVGVYQRLMAKFKLQSPLEAVQELLKGKVTTDPSRHTGQGIFFTSRAADIFTIASDGKRLRVDNRLPDIHLEDLRFRKGTTVHFEIDPHAKTVLSEIFSQYTKEDYAFDTTQVRVTLFQQDSPYVSRSEARRVLSRCERFREIILDFAGVKTIGQAFADEIFRVFQQRHPEITITSTNANENVEFMIRRSVTGESR